MRLSACFTVFSMLLCCVPAASAFEIALTEVQLNAILQSSFPLQQDYQGFHVSLSDPRVQLNGTRQLVSVKSLILAQKQGHSLRAIARAEGQVRYNPQEKVIEIIKPSLVEFTVLDNAIDQSEEAIETIKSAIGQKLPMIFLLDLDQINQLFPGLQPRNIVIRDSSLVVVL